MSSRKRTVEEVYAAFRRKDVAAILERVEPDVEVVQTERLPWGGRYRGVEGLLSFLSRLTERIESEVRMEELFEAGDDVVQVGRTHGRVVGSGHEFDVREVHLWRFRGVRIARFEAFLDTPAMEEALSASLTPAATR